ncbi:T9SS type A sorting domain-containing protein [Flavobacterium sp.]|uniref:RCC1 domain-containing protein n=1 Tax=Flavobacterium sp. TaxID=239 RepID=UPI00391AD7C2
MKKTLLILLLFSQLYVKSQCWLQISAGNFNGGFHSVSIQVDGSLWAWGDNQYGQLGDGTTNNKNVPTRIGMDTDWVIVAAGSRNTYAIKQNGTLWAWGDNSEGQLSDGTIVAKLVPTQVLPDTTWQKVDAGDRFVVAQKTDGTLWSCGYGVYSQLGFNDVSNKEFLTQNTPITDWESISCGFRHTVLRRSDNTIWGFGEGDLGKLATGTDGGLGTPQQLPLLTTGEWSHAIAGSNCAVFRKNDGTLWGVGQNGNGNLGIGNIILGIYPLTQAGNFNDWLSIENAAIHTLALKNNGSLWATGLNTSGQLGIGTLTSTNVFVPVGTATNWAKVRCGRQHTLALDSNGTLWAWGLNSSGQLGDGTTVNKSVPTQIGTVCTLSVNEFEKKVMQVLTNPVDNQVQLSFTYDGVKKLTVYNMQGQAVRTQTVSQDFTSFDVSGFAAGVYFIQCISDMGNQTVKMVKK